MKKLILIKGSPASGKTTLAKKLASKIAGKVSVLTIDEFRWVMASHEPRDEKDFKISWNNYLFVLENYMKENYNIITEDVFIKQFTDKSTNLNDIIKLAKKYNFKITKLFLNCSFKLTKKRNKNRLMKVKDLETIYNKVNENNLNFLHINIDNKTKNQVLKEALEIVSNN